MLLKDKKSRVIACIGIAAIIIGAIFICINFKDDSKEANKRETDSDKAEQYIQTTKTASPEKSYFVRTQNNYIAVLEIPGINLKRGLVSLNDRRNNADYNIQTIETSKMPDKKNSNLILAAHSGNSKVAYFKNLNKLKIGDELNVYYNSIKYTYALSNYYDIDKTGYADIVRDQNKNTLTLVTCKRGTDKQTIFISYLKTKDKY